ncbi:hypothetical protein ACH0BF_02175 [Pseudobacillus sp. 179-B 2D1 NHS]|nr:hypothetical protein [Bacillus badius]KIL74362.1 hypothetical protein SD78_1431 [Bacillus badius]
MKVIKNNTTGMEFQIEDEKLIEYLLEKEEFAEVKPVKKAPAKSKEEK